MPSKTTVRRRWIKENDPGKYDEYLQKQLERNKRRRQEKKRKWIEETHTKEMIAEKERQKQLSSRSKKPSKSTIRRRWTKENNPGKYDEYLQKALERNKKRRQEQKKKWLEEPHTEEMIEERERQLQLSRERSRRYLERQRERFQSPENTAVKSFRQNSKPRRKVKHLTHEEWKAHRNALKRESRARYSEEKRAAVRKIERERAREKRAREREKRLAKRKQKVLISCPTAESENVVTVKSENVVTVKSEEIFPPLKNDLILRAARGQRTERVPVWVMRQAGRYLPEYKEAKGDTKFFATCKNPQLVCELTLQPIRRFNLDAAIIFSDILVIPVAMGLTVANDPGEGPVYADPITCPEDLKRLNPDFDIEAELGYVYEAITLTRVKLEGKVPLFGFTGAPWTLMKFMIENVSAGPNPNKARKFLVEHPEAGHQLLGMLKDAVVRHLVHQIKAGAQIVQVFDSFAGELGPGLFSKFELPVLKQISKGVKEKLQALGLDPVPMVVFAKDAHFAIEDLSASGYDVVGLDWCVQPLHARKLAGNHVTLQGNLDPVMMFAPKDDIRKAVKEMLSKFGTQRYIANLGHGVLKDTDPDHLGVFIDAVHRYSEDMNAVS